MLAPMHPPPTTTTSACLGRLGAANASPMASRLIAVSTFLSLIMNRYGRKTILYLTELPIGGPCRTCGSSARARSGPGSRSWAVGARPRRPSGADPRGHDPRPRHNPFRTRGPDPAGARGGAVPALAETRRRRRHVRQRPSVASGEGPPDVEGLRGPKRDHGQAGL